MPWSSVAVIVTVVAALVLIDRLFLAFERRGWMYWRNSPPSRSRVGTAMLSVQSIFEPDREHLVEERQREEADIDVAEDDDPFDPRVVR